MILNALQTCIAASGHLRCTVAATAIGTMAVFTQDATAQTPEFELPVDCSKSPACLLQNYVDMDPTSERRDPFCGKATYDGHKGTDFRVATVGELRQGVPVLAVADGVILRLRDGVADRLIRNNKDRAAIRDRECGNAVVIDHGTRKGARWTSQTCHLARGSVKVKVGDRVRAGDQIGLMGLSGMTEFPHVHVSFRRDGKIIDPMSARAPGKRGACTARPGNSLWSRQALAAIKKRDTPLLAKGFAGARLSGRDIMLNRIAKPSRAGPLLYYAQFKNLEAGDIIRITIETPERSLVDQSFDPLDRPKAAYMVYSGIKGPLNTNAPYRAWAELIREGKTIFRSEPQKIHF